MPAKGWRKRQIMQWIPSEKKEQSDALFDGQVTEVYLIDGHALPPSAIHEALAQPEQESDDLTAAYMSGLHDGKNKYAPQREWVGLTEEEYKNIRYGSDESGPYVSYGSYDEGYECGSEIEIYVDNFAKAIEAKLREKNT